MAHILEELKTEKVTSFLVQLTHQIIDKKKYFKLFILFILGPFYLPFMAYFFSLIEIAS